MKKLILALMLPLVAAPAFAQSTAQLKRELRAMQSEAKDDPDRLCEAGVWAREKGLDREAGVIFKKVLRMDPDHKGANEAVGNVLYEGEWMAKDKAEKLRIEALEAKYKKDGLVKLGEVWVRPEHEADAKLGIYHHGDDLVTRDEKIGLMAGMVRHPRTGQLIEPHDAEKAETMFQSKDGWLTEEEANKYHKSSSNPWVVRSHYCTLIGTMPIATMDEISRLADSAVESLMPWFGDQQPVPAHRPVIVLAKDTDSYIQLGDGFAGAGGTYGAFVSIETRPLPGFGERWFACANWGEPEPGWKEYFTRHAAGMAYLVGLARGAGVEELPLWLVRAAGGRAERFPNRGIASHYAKQCLNNGGIVPPATFFDTFAIHGDMSVEEIGKTIFQAGLMLDYAIVGDDQVAVDHLKKLAKGFADRDPGAVHQAIAHLERHLRSAEQGINEHFQALLKG